MKPGRELDALVAEKVMGCTLKWDSFLEAWCCGCKDRERKSPHSDNAAYIPKAYSTDIADAWRVVEHFGLVNLTNGPDGWLCRIGVTIGRTIAQVDGRGETAPHAICMAGLEAARFESDHHV